jgi:hypothetical protein
VRWLLASLGTTLMLALPACTTEPPPLHVIIGDPSPQVSRLITDPGELYPTQPGSPAGRILSLATTADGQRVYAGTLRGGVWRSDDRGATWQQLTATPLGDHTTDCSATPPACALPMLTVPDLAVASDTPDLVFAATALDGRTSQVRTGIYRSTNGGHTWARVFQFVCGGEVENVSQISFAPDDPHKLWAAGQCGVAYSVPDASGAVGTQWTFVPLDQNVYHLAVAQSEPGGVRRVYACGPSTMYYSTNGGQSYTLDASLDALNAQICQEQNFTYGLDPTASMLAVAPGHPNLVYAAASSPVSNGYMYLQSDRTSTPIPNGTPCDTANADACGGSLWLGTYPSDPAQAPASTWRQLHSPPVYPGQETGGGLLVKTQPTTQGSYLVYFIDGTTLQVADGAALSGNTASAGDSWHRLDGYDASYLDEHGLLSGRDALIAAELYPTLHVDPHALALGAQSDLALGPSAAPDLAFQHNTEVATCGAGVVYLGSDGGAFSSSVCQTGPSSWSSARNLETLSGELLAGIPQPHRGPALYFGTVDNGPWSTLDGGAHWSNNDLSGCGDCLGYWADPLMPDRLVHLYRGELLPGSLQNGLVAYIGASGGAPNLHRFWQGFHPCPIPGATCSADLGLPPTLPPAAELANHYFTVGADWQAGWRPMVLTTPSSSAPPPIDVVMAAPVSTPTVVLQDPAAPAFAVWRKQTLGTGSADWSMDTPALPVGATTIQAAGGHALPTYYAGDRDTTDTGGGSYLIADSALFGTAAQGDHLYRSYRDPASDRITGWDCIVPGPARAGTHDGACATSATGGATHARIFVSDPYDASVAYLLDDDGIKRTVTGGTTWTRIASLSNWLSDNGAIPTACHQLCQSSMTFVQELASMEFVPNEPAMRFAVGETGIYFTNDGVDEHSAASATEDWHRLLDTSSTACLPRNTFFDTVGLLSPTLYVVCTGRSLLSFINLPRPGEPLNYTMQQGG